MLIDDVRDLQLLRLHAFDKGFWRIRRVDQHPLSRVTVRDQIPEIAVAARAHLLKDEVHESARERLAAQPYPGQPGLSKGRSADYIANPGECSQVPTASSLTLLDRAHTVSLGRSQ